MVIVQQLKKHNISFDIYGKCVGAKYIPMGEFYSILSEHMFYLSFENSYHCKDYITEKLWYNSFFVGLIPIIWGPDKSDLEEILPHNSYIYVEDFKTVSDLVTYLNYLKSNRTAYFEYFQWRLRDPGCFYPLYNHVSNQAIAETILLKENNKINGFCNLCKKLNNKNYINTSSVISSLEKLWLNNERKECIDSISNRKITHLQ